MARSEAERDLLFGLLALQTGLIEQDQLVTAFRAWTRDKSRSIADLLVGRGDLDLDQCEGIEGMVALHLKKHGGDIEKSLAAVPAGRSTREELAGLGDPDIGATLGHVASKNGSTQDGDDPDRTGSHSFGTPSSDGQRFRVLRPHARGGLGAVFVALDAELNREVALKQILDRLADDPTSRQRFLLEAEITGGLEHPGIVPVYGLGFGPDGRPYYAMRFVRGDSLKEAIERFHKNEGLGKDPGLRSLELRNLLRRFVDVCNAIDYAHTRGVLHRDIKPANIILGRHGETLVVDWGLAKAVGKKDHDPTGDERALTPSSASGSSETLPGSALGTPAYMSPEQARGDLDALGPRSDVYCLGATLYCLLTSRLPFEGDDIGVVLRAIQKGEFARPREIQHLVPMALEAVCLKAMALNPDGRYPSARALADDVERWAADEPVSAYRDPALVRLMRWARKHRTEVAVGAALLQTAVVVLAVSTVLLGRSRAQVDRERKRAEAVNKFLVKDLLAQADPENNPAGDKLTVREILDKAAKAVDQSSALKANPEVEGAVRSAIGSTYFGLGLYQLAQAHLERAVQCEAASADVPPAELIFTRNRLVWVDYKLSKPREVSTRMARDVLAQARELLGPDHEETVYAADNFAAMLASEGNFDLYRENLEIQRRVQGPEHLLTIRAAHNFSWGIMVNRSTPKLLAEGMEVARWAYEASQRVLAPDLPDALYAARNYGRYLVRAHRYAEAREVLAPEHERSTRVFGPDSLGLAESSVELAIAEEGLGHLDDALALLQEAVATHMRVVGGGHYRTQWDLANLARVSLALSKDDEVANWCRIILTEGTGGKPVQGFKGDLDGLPEALAGRGDAAKGAGLVGNLREKLWPAWPDDWFRGHVEGLCGEFWHRLAQASDKPDELRSVAEGMMRHAVATMASNPSTPPRFLTAARDRLIRLGLAAPAKPGH